VCSVLLYRAPCCVCVVVVSTVVLYFTTFCITRLHRDISNMELLGDFLYKHALNFRMITEA
jgi:hypothetical protein